jgi:cell wall-associated NlpC family hydrolase
MVRQGTRTRALSLSDRGRSIAHGRRHHHVTTNGAMQISELRYLVKYRGLGTLPRLPRHRSSKRRKAVLQQPATARALRRVVAIAVIGVTSVLMSISASASPSIGQLRAQVAQIQSEVSAIDNQVEAAAEAYNGAVYRLGQIQTRIVQNRATLKRARHDLGRSQEILGERLRASYLQAPPSRVELILSRRSLSDVLGDAEALTRAGEQDAAVVRSVRDLRDRTVATGKQLQLDKARAKDEVASRAHQRAVVTGLLARRQAVLSHAKGRLGAMIAEQRARELRAAALQRQRVQLASRQSSTSAAPAVVPSGGITVSGPGSARNAQAAQIALQYLGVPYVWGGSTPSGFDCSGLASYAYARVGVSMPHYTVAIWSMFPRVVGSLQPGDLVFFHGLGHMGIYIGGGQMVHAPHTGDVVRIVSMAGRGDYVGAVRP